MPESPVFLGSSRVAATYIWIFFITKHLVRKFCRDLVTTLVGYKGATPSSHVWNEMTTSAIPEDVARRRSRRDARVRAYSDLKERRARLAAGTSIKPEFEYELLTMFARNELGAAVTMPALYALFAIACMFWAPTIDAVVWLIIVIGAKVALLDQARRFLALAAGTGQHQLVAAPLRHAGASQRRGARRLRADRRRRSRSRRRRANSSSPRTSSSSRRSSSCWRSAPCSRPAFRQFSTPARFR